ncbi:MAG: hypothetical protein IJ711_00045 [Lachnospiraceae bacterium]|nr:hypothetical protein [Clostridia bacterium]MBR1691145.1 hypothetical protein [Lachnospiraceae bacterium]
MNTTAIINAVAQKLGEGYEVTLNDVVKNNGNKKQGITIRTTDCNIAPTIYLEDFAEYTDGEIAEKIIEVYERNRTPEIEDVCSIFQDKEQVLQRAICRIVNKDQNAETLANIPHTDCLDLAVTYRVQFNMGGGENATALINNQHIEHLGISLEELDQRAKQNTLSLGFETISMAKLMQDIYGLPFPMSEDDAPMWVISNKERFGGATVLCYAKMFSELAVKTGGDLYIIPSSIHEVIAIPVAAGGDTAFLRDMVSSVNGSEVQPEEVLSNSVYKYSIATGELEVAA